VLTEAEVADATRVAEVERIPLATAMFRAQRRKQIAATC
jgi:hypothetical protein